MRFKLIRRCLSAGVGLLLLAAPVSATARECLSPISFNRPPIDWSQAQRQTLAKFFRALAGNWQGSSETFICTSISNSSDVRTGHSEADAKIGVDSQDNLSIRANFYTPSERTRFSESLNLTFGSDGLKVDSWSATLTEISKDTASFYYRLEKRPSNKVPPRFEVRFFALKLRGRNFTLEEQIYVQGILSSGFTWQFSRK